MLSVSQAESTHDNAPTESLPSSLESVGVSTDSMPVKSPIPATDHSKLFGDRPCAACAKTAFFSARAEVSASAVTGVQSAAFGGAVSTEYVSGLGELVTWVIDNFGLLMDGELDSIVLEGIGNWGGDFALKSALWAEEAQ